jgi:hypothetical protein
MGVTNTTIVGGLGIFQHDAPQRKQTNTTNDTEQQRLCMKKDHIRVVRKKV